jgi:hypothetical protein
MTVVNKICLTVSIVSIVSATTLSILAIWGVVESSTLIWRSLATLGVLFLASILTVMVNNIFAEKPGRQDS